MNVRLDLHVDIYCDIDEHEWNSVVYNSKHGSIFHTIEWVTILEKEYGRKILIGAWLNGKLVGVFPCIIGGKDWIKKHIRSFSLGFDYGGPISIIDNPQIIIELISKFEEVAKKEAYKATLTVPLHRNFISEFEVLGYSKRLGSTFIIDLKKPLDKLWGNLDSNARQTVRKAVKKGVTIRSAKNRTEIDQCYEIFVDTAKRAGFGPDSRSKVFYHNLWDTLYERGLAKFFFAEFKNEIISGIILLIFQKTITGFCGGTLTKYRSYEPNSLLFWHIIEWGNKNGFKYFDLAGADLPNLYQFKKKWGGNLTNFYILTKTYPSLSYGLLALYYKFRRSLYKIKKRFIKK